MIRCSSSMSDAVVSHSVWHDLTAEHRCAMAMVMVRCVEDGVQRSQGDLYAFTDNGVRIVGVMTGVVKQSNDNVTKTQIEIAFSNR